METQPSSKISAKTESVESIETAAEASENLTTTAQLGLVDQSQPPDPEEEPDSGPGIDGVNMPDVQPMPVVRLRPQLRLMQPDRPVRYIPIHIWYIFYAFETQGQGAHGSSFHLSFQARAS